MSGPDDEDDLTPDERSILRNAIARGVVDATGASWVAGVDLAAGPDETAVTINRARFLRDVPRLPDLADADLADAERRTMAMVDEELRRRFAQVRVVDGEPDELARSLAGSSVVTADQVRAVAEGLWNDFAPLFLPATGPREQGLLRAPTDADGGYLVPPDVADGIREATFRGVPIRYGPPEYRPTRPAPDREDSVVENAIDATCTPWELVDVEDADDRCPCGCEGPVGVAHPDKAALSWDDFMQQSAALIDEQERRRG